MALALTSRSSTLAMSAPIKFQIMVAISSKLGNSLSMISYLSRYSQMHKPFSRKEIRGVRVEGLGGG